MKTNCERHSESLLLLVHGELKGWPRLRTETHLIACPTCRAKEQRLRALSNTLALSLNNPSLGFRTFRKPRRIVWTTLGMGVLSAAFLGWQASSIGFSSPTSAGDVVELHCDQKAAHTVSRAPDPPPIPPTPKTISKATSPEKTRACKRTGASFTTDLR